MIDVLIIGSGGAGLSVALEAKKNFKNVIVVSKTYPTASQTSQAQGGINAVTTNVKDNITSHINDTLQSAHNIGNEQNIQYMCENAHETIKWLDKLGVPFSRDELSNISQRSLGGASYKRACYSSDYTGLKIIHTLYDNCIKENIEFLDEYIVIEFIKDKDKIIGAIFLEIATTNIKILYAHNIIIATGGYAGIYNGHTTNSTANTGEVINLAYKIGCQLENMEYIQFHPTAMKNSCILVSESARGEGGYLVTEDGNRFIDELKPRDIVARAILDKINNEHRVYLDMRHLGLNKIQESIPQEYELANIFANIKLDKELLEISPASHYTMGGIKTNIDGKTTIKNLYAVGECSSNGVHGANRLGGNSLLEIITFGRRVGQKLNLHTNKIIVTDEKNILTNITKKFHNIYRLPNKINFQTIKKELGRLMYKNVGLYRDESSLKEMQNQLNIWENQLKLMGIDDKSKIYNTDLKEFIEFTNSLELSSLIVKSALDRKESRGSHFRIDFPKEKNFYAKPTIIQMDTI